MKNKYVRRSKISEAKFRKIIIYFSLELDSQKIAALTGLNRNTVNRYLGRIRGRIVELSESQACQNHIRVPADRDVPVHTAPDMRTGEENLPVFGIRSRNDLIYTRLFPSGVHRILRRCIREDPAGRTSSVPMEWRFFDGIVDLNSRRHYRLNPIAAEDRPLGESEDDLEAFLGFARKRLPTLHLNGGDHFNLYLKECEFRYNNRDQDLYQVLLKQFRENPLF